MSILFKNILLENVRKILSESKQSIINLGYPEVVASLIYEKFGNKSFTIAKWYKEYKAYDKNRKDWFSWFNDSNGRELSLTNMLDLYNATNDPQKYLEVSKRLELSTNDFIDSPEYMEQQRKMIREEISKSLFGQTFFVSYLIIKDIVSGKLKNIKPYAEMTFEDARLKYDESRIFDKIKPIKVYDDGYKWINAGKKCEILGHYMKNCGSAGLMTSDPDGTLIGLFDANNKPHVIITYSPNLNTLQGDEGVGSTEVKDKYHSYILDLAKILNADFQSHKTKSTFMRLKYILKDKKIKDLKRIKLGNEYYQYFYFIKDNIPYVTNGYEVVSKDDLMKSITAVKNGTVNASDKQDSGIVFNYLYKSEFKQIGVNFIPIQQI